MLTNFMRGTTDATRRAALQLAVQLPEDVAEARAVLAQVEAVLEGFLIARPAVVAVAVSESCVVQGPARPTEAQRQAHKAMTPQCLDRCNLRSRP